MQLEIKDGKVVVKEAVTGSKIDRVGVLKSHLAAYTLIYMYDKGGYGTDVAKLRIELALKDATGMDQVYLKKVLEGPLFKARP